MTVSDVKPGIWMLNVLGLTAVLLVFYIGLSGDQRRESMAMCSTDDGPC